MKRTLDVIVIGAGPAGLSAAVYLKRSSLSCLVMEKSAPGGKLNTIHRIENYPGFPSVSGPELSMAFYKQATSLGIEIAFEAATRIEKVGERFFVFGEENEYEAKAVIIACGMGNPAMKVKGEKEHLGRGVSYCATCDGAFFRNKDVVVYGHDERALEDAVYLSSICSSVTLLSSSPMQASELLKENALRLGIRFLEGKATLIEGDPLVKKILYTHDNIQSELKASAFFNLESGEVEAGLLSGFDVFSPKGFLLIDGNGETRVPGLYGAGDVVEKKLRQIVNAASEGAIAATSAIAYIRSLI